MCVEPVEPIREVTDDADTDVFDARVRIQECLEACSRRRSGPSVQRFEWAQDVQPTHHWKFHIDTLEIDQFSATRNANSEVLEPFSHWRARERIDCAHGNGTELAKQ